VPRLGPGEQRDDLQQRRQRQHAERRAADRLGELVAPPEDDDDERGGEGDRDGRRDDRAAPGTSLRAG
jgi:hypothetical protein